VVEAISGYTGGRGDNPTYENYGQKGHVEAVQVVYDPAKVSYKELLDYFWRHIDPTDPGGQFVDRGPPISQRSFFTMMPTSSDWRRHPSRPWKSQNVSPNPW